MAKRKVRWVSPISDEDMVPDGIVPDGRALRVPALLADAARFGNRDAVDLSLHQPGFRAWAQQTVWTRPMMRLD
jgi:hypothetical protein